MNDDVKCKCNVCGCDVIVESFSGLSDDEVCLGIVCEDCMDEIQYKEDYGEDE